MKQCQKCGAFLDDSATFCGSCGTKADAVVQQPAQVNTPPVSAAPPVSTPQTSGQYGAPVTQNSAYVANGASYQGGAVQVAQKKQMKKSTSIILGIVAAAVLAGIAAVLIFFVFNEKPSAEETLITYMGKVKKLELRDAVEGNGYDYNFLKDNSELETSLKQAEESIEQNPEQVKLVRALFTEVKIKVTDEEKLSKSEVGDLKDKWSSDHKDTDKIKEIHKMKYEVDSFGNVEKGESYAILIKGTWYFKDVDENSSTSSLTEQ